MKPNFKDIELNLKTKSVSKMEWEEKFKVKPENRLKILFGKQWNKFLLNLFTQKMI